MAVGTRTETLDDLYTTTFLNRTKSGLVDSIFNAIPFWTKMRAASDKIRFNGTGGRLLEVDLSYAKNETVTSIGKGDTVSLSETKFMTVAQYPWSFVAGSVVRYFTDDSVNKSVSQHIQWANQKIDNLRDSMADKFETYLFADGTGNSSKDPLGLDALISTTPTTGSVGNISRVDNSWWRNTQKTATGAASVYLLSDMRNLANTISESKNRELPDTIITTQTVAELFDDEVLEQRSLVNVKGESDPESMSTAWKGVPIMWSSQCPSGRMYMLRSGAFALVTDPDIDFSPTEWKSIPNQVNDRVMQIAWKGQFVSSRLRSGGVMTGIA
jgi:hypothetical protein